MWNAPTTATRTALVGLIVLAVSCQSTDGTAVEFDIAHAEFQAFAASPPAIAPDGSAVVFAAGRRSAGSSRLWLHTIAENEARPLPGTEGAQYPFWAPDNQRIAFFVDTVLKAVDVTTGAVDQLSFLPGTGRGGTWNEAGDILFAVTGGAIYLIPEGGLGPEPLTHVDSWSRKRMPQFLPDGRQFIFFASERGWHEPGIAVASLDSPESSFVVESSSAARYVEPGYLLFERDGALLAQKFDDRGVDSRLSGEPFVVAPDLGPSRDGSFDASLGGVLAFRTGGMSLEWSPTWFGRDGRELGQPLAAGNYQSPALSPNQGRLAAWVPDGQTGESDIWAYDLDQGTSVRVTGDDSVDVAPVWSPGGSEVAFASTRDGVMGLFAGSSTGEGELRDLSRDAAWPGPSDWSRDGSYILASTALGQIAALPTDGTGSVIPVGEPGDQNRRGRFSPDGRWVAFERHTSELVDVVVSSFPPTNAEVVRMSAEGGSEPFWRDDGRELYFVSREGRIMAVPVDVVDGAIVAGVPEPLFQMPMGAGDYVAAGDGQRFLVLVPTPADAGLKVIVNWLATIDLAGAG